MGLGFIQVGITGYFVKIDFVFTRDNTFLINHLKMFSTALAILNSINFCSFSLLVSFVFLLCTTIMIKELVVRHGLEFGHGFGPIRQFE